MPRKDLRINKNSGVAERFFWVEGVVDMLRGTVMEPMIQGGKKSRIIKRNGEKKRKKNRDKKDCSGPDSCRLSSNVVSDPASKAAVREHCLQRRCNMILLFFKSERGSKGLNNADADGEMGADDRPRRDETNVCRKPTNQLTLED